MDYFKTLTLLPKLYHNTRKEGEKEGTWCIVGHLLPASGIFRGHRNLREISDHMWFCCKYSLSYSFLYCSMSGHKVKKDSKDPAAANGSVSATMKKALMSNSTWEDKVGLSRFKQCTRARVLERTHSDRSLICRSKRFMTNVKVSL